MITIKQGFIFALLIFGALFLPISAYAASGACSYHGGVDCSAGADWDGSVICNDGWRESSVSYSSMVMCGGGYDYYALPPSCPLFASYDPLSDSCKCNYGYVAQNGSCVSRDSACQDQLGYGARYNVLDDTCECGYGDVISGGRCQSGNSVCQLKHGFRSSYRSYSGKCECDSGYIFGSSGQCVSEDDACEEEFGSHAEYKYAGTCGCKSGYVFNDSKTRCIEEENETPSFTLPPVSCPANAVALSGTCYCLEGYLADGDRCITYDQGCQKKYGLNSNGDKDYCYCDAGYQFDQGKTTCVIKPTPSTPVSPPANTSAPSVSNQDKAETKPVPVAPATTKTRVLKAEQKAITVSTTISATPTSSESKPSELPAATKPPGIFKRGWQLLRNLFR